MAQADIVKRLTVTALEIMLWLSGTSIRVQTTCRAVGKPARTITCAIQWAPDSLVKTSIETLS